MTGLEFADTGKDPSPENQDSILMGDLVKSMQVSLYVRLPL